MKWSSPLVIFVIASASIHLGLLMSINSQKTTIILPGAAGSMLAVKVLPVKSNITPAQARAEKQSRLQHKKTVTMVANKKTAISNKPTGPVSLSSNKTSDTKQQPPRQQQNSIAQSRVISILVNELRQYFHYPRLAQKRNWQGKVVVALHITRSGEIKDIMLSRSSGYTVLDEAAIRAIQKIKTFPDMAVWQGQDLKLELPVLYKLTEG